MSPQLLLPIFGGQGMSFYDARNGWDNFSHLVSSPSGSLLLHTCHATFHEELSSLGAEDRKNVHICASDFSDKASILYPTNKEYFENPTLSGSILLLEQCLRFLAYIQNASKETGSASPFLDVMKRNRDLEVGILGFSSGILSACVVAVSSSIPSFIVHCVEAYRLALWIGIRSRLYQVAHLHISPLSTFRPWSLMLLGISKNDAQEAIEIFNTSSTYRICITAVMSDDCITISGHPDDLSSFEATLPNGVTACTTKINALYHCATQLHAVRNQVVADVASRNIRFPALADLLIPIRSTFTGNLISTATSSDSLVELIVDMVLIHPINWDQVTSKTAKILPHDQDIHVLNIGLGSSLVRRLESDLSRDTANFRILDLSDISLPKAEVKQEPIAIIGMAVNMPGASTVDQLWDLLKDGRNTLTEIPDDRFNYDMYTNGHISGRSMQTRTGNFVKNVGHFDHKFFNINPREAKSMDPQQRILLQVGYEALENAGYVPHSSPTFNPDTFGCYIGSATHDYVQNLRNEIDVYYSTGTLKAFLSGRLSYCLGFSGPSVVVDTACSSSMVAIYQASRALMNKDCHAALAGGVNVISSPDAFLGLDKGHFLSPSGQCKSFDAAADGYSRGEGCGIFVLKRLADAVAENDRVLGVIRGIEVNQSGKAHSITHPHVPTQAALFRQVLSCSDIDPNSVNVVEAHGTGTQAGDMNEMESIRHVLNVDRTPNNPLYVTSIKANIGHLEAASGCASLAKVLLMLQYDLIPQQISLRTLNPRFSRLDADNTIISKTNVPWSPIGQGQPRVALINNFGAAGSNTALLLQEYMSSPSSWPMAQHNSFVVGLSAKDKISLDAMRSKLVEWLQNPANDEISLANIAYTLTARRQSYPYRLAVSAATKHDLVKKLDAAPISDTPAHTMPVIFVFSGQGSQYHGMGRSFYESSPLFRRHINECNDILISLGFPGIIRTISANEEAGWTTRDTEDSQTALFSLQYALVQVWRSWGINPIAVVGHSLGEYAALVTAGVVSLRDALLIVATRAQLMITRCAPMTTGMVAISLPPSEVQAILASRNVFSGLSIACFNSPKDCVISGPLLPLQEFRNQVEKEKICKTTQLSIPYAGHSPTMAPLTEDLIMLASQINTRSIQVPYISTVLGRTILPGDQSFPPEDYFARQCTDPVRFSEGIDSYLTNPTNPGNAIWLEVGPHPGILPMLRSFPSMSGSILLASLCKGEDSWTTLSRSLASLYAVQYRVDWRRVFHEIGPTRCIDLPSYPFATQNFWVPFAEVDSSELSTRNRTKFSFIGNWSQFPNDNACGISIFETPMSQVKGYIEGHQVGGVPLCSASVYLEMAYAAISLSMENLLQPMDGLDIDLHRISFSKALTWNFADEEGHTTVIIIVDILARTFSVKSRAFNNKTETLHASGEYGLSSSIETANAFLSEFPLISRSVDEILKPINGQTPETFSTRTIYQVIFPRVVQYSKEFQNLEYLAMLPNELEATAIMKPVPDHDSNTFFVHPIFLDTLIHMAGFVANLHGGLNEAYICTEIGSVQVLRHQLDVPASCVLHCKLSNETEKDMVGECSAYTQGQSRVLFARVSGIRFQRVRLSGLKAGLASISGKFSPISGPQSEIEEVDDRYSRSSIMTAIQRIISQACEVDANDVSFDQELDYLGVDSLMRLELARDLSHTFPPFEYRPQEITLCRTVADILDLISKDLNLNPLDLCVDQERPQTPASIRSVFSSPRTLVHPKTTSPVVRRVLAHILDIEEEAMSDDAELGTLGFDSLASVEAFQTLKHRYNLDIPKAMISPTQTLRDIERQISELEPSALPALASPCQLSRNPFNKMCKALSLHRSLTLIQNADTKLAPLVLIHDGSGLTVSYERLSTLGRRVWGISNPRFSTSDQWTGIFEMAQAYANLILNEIEGPVILGGWSFGGVVAIEVAKKISLLSMTVKGVLLIDSPTPLSHVPLSPPLVDSVLDTAQNLDSELRKLCKEQFMMNAQLLATHIPQNSLKYIHPPILFLRSVEPYNPPMEESIPSWLSDRTDPESVIRGWNVLSEGRLVRTLDIPGHHFGAFDPQNVALVSKRIVEACEILDKLD